MNEIDYENYSLNELRDARSQIDAEQWPERAAELDRRITEREQQVQQSGVAAPYGSLVDQDDEHLRMLKIGYYVSAGMSATTIVALVIQGVFIFVMSRAPVWSNRDGSQEPVDDSFLVLYGIVFGVFAMVAIAATVLEYLTGKYIGKRKHRTFCLVSAALTCLSMPIGTVLGVFTFIVLGRDSVQSKFDRPTPPSDQPLRSVIDANSSPST